MSFSSTPGARLVSALLAIFFLLLASSAHASEPQPQRRFDIPAQDLAQALDSYGEASGMAVLVDRELTRGRRSAPLKGHFSVKQGLSRLLAGSGLMALHAGDNAFTVLPARLDDDTFAPGNAPQRERQSSFAAKLQETLGRVLCDHPATRAKNFRAAMQLWISPSGRVEHSRLLASTGDLNRDDVLIGSLGQLRIDQPPPSSLAQPVTVLILPKASGEKGCSGQDAVGE